MHKVFAVVRVDLQIPNENPPGFASSPVVLTTGIALKMVSLNRCQSYAIVPFSRLEFSTALLMAMSIMSMIDVMTLSIPLPRVT